MRSRIDTVSQGICGTERPDSGNKTSGKNVAEKCKVRFPLGFDAPPSHYRRNLFCLPKAKEVSSCILGKITGNLARGQYTRKYQGFGDFIR